MIDQSRIRSASATLAASAATFLLTGCALIQPPPVPRFGVRSYTGNAGCGAEVARAHVALAAAGAAAGDPAATAAAHATAAEAMASYHACLARTDLP